jgi:hypothetical protein
MDSRCRAIVLTWDDALESKQARCTEIMGRLLLHRKNQRKAMHTTLVCPTQHRNMGATGMTKQNLIRILVVVEILLIAALIWMVIK